MSARLPSSRGRTIGTVFGSAGFSGRLPTGNRARAAASPENPEDELAAGGVASIWSASERRPTSRSRPSVTTSMRRGGAAQDVLNAGGSQR